MSCLSSPNPVKFTPELFTLDMESHRGPNTVTEGEAQRCFSIDSILDLTDNPSEKLLFQTRFAGQNTFFHKYIIA